MILMSITMFTLGVLALLDTIYNYGDVFRVIFSFMLIGFSVLLFAKAKTMPFFEKPDMSITSIDVSLPRTETHSVSHPAKEIKAETINR